VVILHAFSKDGWLVKDPKIFMNRADQYLPSCELVYEAANSDGDYHKNMNGEIFLNWVNHRLIPAFEAKYGRKKKMILVLDNAAYHHWMGPNGWTPSKLNKKQLAHKLEDLCKLKSITVKRQPAGGGEEKEKEFESYTWVHNGTTLSPSCEELRTKLKECLKADPTLNPSMVRSVFMEHEHQLIFTPPYLPDVQPIERAWAYVKNYVARQFRVGRTMPQLLVQIRQGFYGDGLLHAGLDEKLAQKIIQHSHDFCNRWIDDEETLEGNIELLSTVIKPPKPDSEEEVDAELDLLSVEPDVEEQED